MLGDARAAGAELRLRQCRPESLLSGTELCHSLMTRPSCTGSFRTIKPLRKSLGSGDRVLQHALDVIQFLPAAMGNRAAQPTTGHGR